MSTNEILNFGSDIFKNGAILSITYIIVLLIIRSVLKKYVIKFISKKIQLKNHELETSLKFASNILRVLIDIVIFSLIIMEFKAFESLGTVVVGASSAMAVIVGFAAQESTANFVGGFFLTIFQPIKIGDIVKLTNEDIMGTVVNITIRHTVIRTFNNTNIIVPNATMNSAIIENFDEPDIYTCLLTYGVAYGSDYNKAMKILADLAINHPLSINKKEIAVIVTGLADFSVNLRVKVQTENFSNGFTLKTDLNKLVLEKFESENISIPFPTQTIYTNNKGN
jgi:small-conductance mechanosensitive channel